jgi:hypothetical protein
MSLGLRCPACQKKMSVPEHAVGRRVLCPHCEATFRYTGQKEYTLGRVGGRKAAFAGVATRAGAASTAADATPVVKPVGPDLPEMPRQADLDTFQDEGQTMPVIDLPEMPQALLDQLKLPAQEEIELIEDVDEPLDLEVFHSTPAETTLPEVSEAEIEALFQDAAPDAETTARPASNPTIRFSESTLPLPPKTLPSLDLGPAEAAMVSEDDIMEILESDPEFEAILDAEAVEPEIVEVEDVTEIDDVVEVDEVMAVEIDDPAETLPVPQAKIAKPLPPDNLEDVTAPDFQIDPNYFNAPAAAPVLMAKPVLGAAPVAGMPVAAVPRGQAIPTAPVAVPAQPVSNDPIPPPTPPSQPPLNDDDLDALFQDAIEEIPVVADDEIQEVEVVEEVVVTGAEGEPDLMALFEDDPNTAPAADAIEVVEDAEFLFEDETPPNPAKKR